MVGRFKHPTVVLLGLEIQCFRRGYEMTRTDPLLASRLEADAVARYERALADAANIREAWEAQGRVLTVTLPNGCEIASPLWKLLQAVEVHTAKMARELRGPARPGRKSFFETSQSAPSPALGTSPATRLRQLKDAS